MKLILLLVCFLLFHHNLQATVQSPDFIIIEKDTFPLFVNLLKGKEQLLEQDSVFMQTNALMSDCQRGFVALWEIENQQLYLVELAGCGNGLIEDDKEFYELFGIDPGDLPKDAYVNLELIFPSKYQDGKVLVDWFTGAISIPKGNAIYYKHSYSAIFEFKHEINIEQGQVVKETTFDNRKTSLNYFNNDLGKFVINKLSKKVLKKMKEMNTDIRIAPILFFNLKQRVTRVKFQHPKLVPFRRDIKRILLHIDNWNIRYWKGKPDRTPNWCYIYWSQKTIQKHLVLKEK